MDSPSNRLPPQYDGIAPDNFDPAFTENITSQMRVPNSIGVKDHSDDMISHALSMEDFERFRSNVHMAVPDRILVAGQDQHIGMREELDLKLDIMKDAGMDHQRNFVGLQTPPRVLTLNEQAFPEPEANAHPESHESLPGSSYQTPRNQAVRPYSADLLATPGDGLLLYDDDMDDVTVLKRQVGKLTRHVIQLEAESASRKTRELMLYPVVFGYILMQVARWFLRNN